MPMEKANVIEGTSSVTGYSVETYLRPDNAEYIIKSFMKHASIDAISEFKEFMSKSVEEIQAERDAEVEKAKKERLKQIKEYKKKKKEFLKEHPECDGDMYDNIFLFNTLNVY